MNQPSAIGSTKIAPVEPGFGLYDVARLQNIVRRVGIRPGRADDDDFRPRRRRPDRIQGLADHWLEFFGGHISFAARSENNHKPVIGPHHCGNLISEYVALIVAGCDVP